jgi:hypothetical protein
LLQKRIPELEAANEAATQHSSHKRKRGCRRTVFLLLRMECA